jgi:hypothetical protein
MRASIISVAAVRPIFSKRRGLSSACPKSGVKKKYRKIERIRWNFILLKFEKPLEKY